MSVPVETKSLEREPETQAEEAERTRPRLVAPIGPDAMLVLQRSAGNRALGAWLQASARSGDGAPLLLQRKPDDGGTSTPAPQTDQGAPTTQTPATQAPAPTLIVEDDAQQVQPGQMRKSDFLDQLKASVCNAADEALRGTIWSTAGCPYVERWVSHYQQQSSQHVERALHKYAPETASARTAKEYIPLVTERVRRGVVEWAKTGEVTGVPPELAQEGMPGATFQGLVGAGLSALGGALGGVISGIGRAVSGAVSAVGSAVSGAVSGIGRAFAKSREGTSGESDNPRMVQAQLSGGQPLEASTRSRMESAFGADFSSVRIHTDGNAAGLSDRLNARAFTVGSDIAFGSGEYQPGNLVGEALLAHELAHVVQQREGSTLAQTKGAADYGALEEDADVSAVGAIAAAWEGATGTLQDIGRQAMPRLRSGLRLQRCGGAQSQVTRASGGAQGLTCPPSVAATGSGGEAGASRLDARAQAIIAIAQDTSRPLNERAVQVVTSILCQYYPSEVSKVTEVVYDAGEPGLHTFAVGRGPTTRGRIKVGSYFVQQTERTHFARRVLQVGHELQHIDQYRAGMVGEARGTEREFLARYWTALHDELPGTGRMPDATRRGLIDGALECYYCLTEDQQREYEDNKRRLLERRETVNGTRGNPRTEPPTECPSGGCRQ
jgi:Domain of unknown function (DUF4157)